MTCHSRRGGSGSTPPPRTCDSVACMPGRRGSHQALCCNRACHPKLPTWRHDGKHGGASGSPCACTCTRLTHVEDAVHQLHLYVELRNSEMRLHSADSLCGSCRRWHASCRRAHAPACIMMLASGTRADRRTMIYSVTAGVSWPHPKTRRMQRGHSIGMLRICRHLRPVPTAGQPASANCV